MLYGFKKVAVMSTKGRGFLLAASLAGLMIGAAPALAQSHGGGGGHAGGGGGHMSGGHMGGGAHASAGHVGGGAHFGPAGGMHGYGGGGEAPRIATDDARAGGADGAVVARG